MRDSPQRLRLEALLDAAKRLRDPAVPAGKSARRALYGSTGLSSEGVDLALDLCLEVDPSEADLQRLLSHVVQTRRAHVLLSANVFVAAHRAILLGLAASPEVWVRSSRREPSMARLLWELTPGLFELVEELTPKPGDQLFAYGNQATLTKVEEQLPKQVLLHAHGPGFGLLVVQQHAALPKDSWEDLARRLAPDLVLFDQRGCLSPRVVLFEGSAESALALAQAVASELAAWESRVPLGRLTPEDTAEIVRFRDSFTVAGSALPAGCGWVCVAPEASEATLAPVGRNLLLIPVRDAITRAGRLSRQVTTFAVHGNDAFSLALSAVLPHARASTFGNLQRPPLDGPVDLRPATLK